VSKHRKSARDQPCIRCGIEDGTTVLAHYQGPMSNLLGKGLGLKGNDLAAAYLCHNCHAIMDGRTKDGLMSVYERGHHFAMLCLMTIIRRHKSGQL